MSEKSTLDELREIDRLAAAINQRLDAMYAKLGKVVVAAETANEILTSLLSLVPGPGPAGNPGNLGCDGLPMDHAADRNLPITGERGPAKPSR
jgi:hypothetical protein